MLNTYKVYALIDKNAIKKIKYIGITRKSLIERKNNHLRDKQITHKTNWIKKIGKNNLDIVLLYDGLTKEDAIKKECELIKYYRDNGTKLTNTTNGGEGWFNTQFTIEHKLNISKNHADVSKEKNPMYNKNHTEKTKLKIIHI